MFEQYLDETQVAQALSALSPEDRGLLERANRPPVKPCERIAASLADQQPAALNCTADERRRYLRLLEDRIAGADVATARRERESEPLLDSICYELTLGKLPTFEHYTAELA